MARLEGGTFTMGARGDRVTVQPFELDVTEVTVEQYTRCVRDQACTSDRLRERSVDASHHMPDDACNYGQLGKGGHPMNCVDLGQADAFCRAQGKRLPTEEEWEWAARGASAGRVYALGRRRAPGRPDASAGPESSSASATCPVASARQDDAPGEVHDLAGDVQEWTSSREAGPSGRWITRGGAWDERDERLLRASSRRPQPPDERRASLGFRCAR